MPFWSTPKTSLNQRLRLGLGAMLVPLLMLATGAIISFEGALGSFDKHDNLGREALFPLAEVEGLFLDLNVVASPVGPSRPMTWDKYQEKSQAITNSLERLLEFSHHDPHQFNSVLEIQRKWQRISQLCKQLLDPSISESGNTQSTRVELQDQLRMILQDVQQLNYRLIVFQNDANTNQAKAVRKEVRQLIAMICGLALALAIVFAYGLSRSITVPLQTLEEGVEKLGKGELSHRIALASGDELSHLAETFNLMATKLEQSQKDLYRLATLDGLTEVYNRREFNRWLRVEVEKSQRNTDQVSLIMVDIDHFKQLNDTFGHQAGDLALCEVAQLLQREVRPGDIVCRYGGEEFAVILPKTNSDDSVAIADRIRLAIAEETVILPSLQQVEMTASLGVATFPADAQTKEHLIKQADQALYGAKTSGRNRVHQAQQNVLENKVVV
ncbi:GGDEF domain-containing protein [Acaryochloris marina]|uniref:GGDEF domain-containing protein n=1 Tax=Acaryochloris marina TaxID=155978 RepID=UPI001BAE9835|nr:diguanylate cyclase [Acaryochloris marina]QUY41116.1 diguanylate cyclase [Acaryochloris marina S15]